MNPTRSQAIDSFRMQFQRDLREYLARNGSAADAFGRIWEQTSRDVTLDEESRAQLYWELVNWLRSYDLFTVDPHTPPRPQNRA
jgi:hypothetical protein